MDRIRRKSKNVMEKKQRDAKGQNKKGQRKRTEE